MSQMDFNNNFFNEDVPPIVNSSEPHMACLFLLDTSGSMGVPSSGVVPIDALNDAINRFKAQVCQDDKTADILDVAIVEFNNSINVIQDFSPVEYMQPVNLTATGGTYMAPAIEKAIEMVDERSRFYRRMGTEPYKPWIVMISDGAPLDNIDEVSNRLTTLSNTGKLAFWSLSLSNSADKVVHNKVLHKLSGDRVLNLVEYNFAGFFDWVNKSMRAVSESSPGEKPLLPPQNEAFTLDPLQGLG